MFARSFQARRKEIAARKIKTAEQLEWELATKARVEQFDAVATVHKRSDRADAALARIIEFLEDVSFQNFKDGADDVFQDACTCPRIGCAADAAVTVLPSTVLEQAHDG